MKSYSRSGEPVVLTVADLRYIVSSANDSMRKLYDLFGMDAHDRFGEIELNASSSCSSLNRARSRSRGQSFGTADDLNRNGVQRTGKHNIMDPTVVAAKGWMSTGLLPHFITMRFKERWLIEKVM